MNEPDSSNRSRRQRSDKGGRLSALEKLKQLKGAKNKYEVEDVENVYEEVDEKEYSKAVLERQNDDWIVDDGNSGYVEDGREIFDDDLDDESIQQASRNKVSGPRKRKKGDGKKKGSIQNMFGNMAAKKKTLEASSDDLILGDLMNELKAEQPAKKPQPTLTRNVFHKSTKENLPDNHKQESNVDADIETSKIAEDVKDGNLSSDTEIFDMPVPLPTPEKRKPLQKQLAFPLPAKRSMETTVATENTEPLDKDNESNEKASERKDTPKDSNDDLSEFVGDLSTVDFDSMDEDNKSSSRKDDVEQRVSGRPRIMQADNKGKLEGTVGKVLPGYTDFQKPMPEIKVPQVSASMPLPFVQGKDENVMRFFWWDAYEDPYKQPGVVFMFGKVHVPREGYVSCCLTVKNIPRRVYLLPREYDSDGNLVSLDDVYQEFNNFANTKGIKEFKSGRVSKRYAFEQEGVPELSDYLEVRYSAHYSAIDSNYSGRTIQRVFGTSMNAIELLLIERKIKGPCWLDIKGAVPTGMQTSWCKVKANCMKMENISVCTEIDGLSIPPMVTAALNVRMCLNTKLQQNEVVMIVVLLHSSFCVDKEPPNPPFQMQTCFVTNPRDVPWPRHARETLSKLRFNIKVCESESDLCEQLLQLLDRVDPDLLVTHDSGFQLDVLMHRMYNLKVPNWSRISRLKRMTPSIFKGKVNLGQALAGRPMCDIEKSARELCVKVRSFDLQSLCMEVLKKSENECKEIKSEECAAYFGTLERIENLIQITANEAYNILCIMFELNVMPLALQITCIAGNILSRTLSAGRAERNEFLLMHAFHRKDYITPDKRSSKDSAPGEGPRRKKAAYAGGMVLEPQKGFYNKLILLMDFNSLYPSIIQEYNLCFTTVPGAAYAEYDELTIPDADKETGVIPTEIRKLVESRVQVKNLLKQSNITPEQKMQYHIKQLALKLTANSMYGCLGATHCRFYARGLAALITSKGREILLHTKGLVERMRYNVIYGDTDSIMINTNIEIDRYDEVFSIGKKIKQEVNKQYKRVELDIDGVFQYLLLYQKKKYAALSVTKLPNGQMKKEQELKGLDIVRRDWCQLASETGRKIIDHLLSDQLKEMRQEHITEILQSVGKAIKENEAPLSSLVITKQLSKNPNDYPDQKQAHVSVALRLNKAGGRKWKAGDTVPYIVCDDGTTRSAVERAYHIDEFKKNATLKIDINYYLTSQVFPIVDRICAPIEGLDDTLIAQYLGMENYKSRSSNVEDELNYVPMSIDEERFKTCLPLKFQCRNYNCQMDITVQGLTHEFHSGIDLALAKCPNLECRMAPWKYVGALQNIVQNEMRRAINEYYSEWMECEDPRCSNKTRVLPLDFQRKFPKCNKCKQNVMYRVTSEKNLYDQLCFYQQMFDLSRCHRKQLLAQCPSELILAYNVLKETVEKVLKRSAYNIVYLDSVFAAYSVMNFDYNIAVVNSEGLESAEIGIDDDGDLYDAIDFELESSKEAGQAEAL